jgi:hypothetical protein
MAMTSVTLSVTLETIDCSLHFSAVCLCGVFQGKYTIEFLLVQQGQNVLIAEFLF